MLCVYVLTSRTWNKSERAEMLCVCTNQQNLEHHRYKSLTLKLGDERRVLFQYRQEKLQTVARQRVLVKENLLVPEIFNIRRSRVIFNINYCSLLFIIIVIIVIFIITIIIITIIIITITIIIITIILLLLLIYYYYYYYFIIIIVNYYYYYY